MPFPPPWAIKYPFGLEIKVSSHQSGCRSELACLPGLAGMLACRSAPRGVSSKSHEFGRLPARHIANTFAPVFGCCPNPVKMTMSILATTCFFLSFLVSISPCRIERPTSRNRPILHRRPQLGRRGSAMPCKTINRPSVSRDHDPSPGNQGCLFWAVPALHKRVTEKLALHLRILNC